MIQQKGAPRSINNGHEVISFMDSVEVQKALSVGSGFDYPTLTSFYKEDPNNRHKGMMSLWGQQTSVNYQKSNIVQDLYMKGDVWEVNGWQGGFTHDLPIYDFKGCYVTRDTSNQDAPGIDGNTFKLVLNKAFTAGDKLTSDKMHGQEVIVSGEEPVVAVAEGYEHTVTLVTNDKKMTYNKKYLTKGRQYSKRGHAIDGELGTKFSSIQLPDTVGTQTVEFSLGAFSGVESFITGKADSTSFRGGDAKSKQYLDLLAQEFGEDKQYAVLAPLKKGADGKSRPDFKNMKLGATIEYLTMRELERITHNRLMWAKAGTVQGTNSVMKMNEGLWSQLRRGKVMQYPKPGGITRKDLVELAEYVFKVSPKLPVEKRRLKLKAGRFAYENILEIFKDEVRAQIDRISPLLGADALLKGVVTGDLMSLKLNPVRFTNVFLNGIGYVDIEEDTSLNYDDDDRLSRGIHANGMASTAYSVVIWNANDQQYSNNKELPKGAKRMDSNAKDTSNIHLVKPEGDMLYFGSTNGRYDYKKSSDIMSGGAIKSIAQEFWCFQVCDVYVSDASPFVMLELDPEALKGYN